MAVNKSFYGRDFSTVIEHAMRVQQLTYIALAKKAKLSTATIFRALRVNGQGLNLRNFEKIMNALGMHPKDIWDPFVIEHAKSTIALYPDLREVKKKAGRPKKKQARRPAMNAIKIESEGHDVEG